MILRAILIGVSLSSVAGPAPGADAFGPDDLSRLVTVAEPALSPDGQLLVYSAETANSEEDKQQSDLWATSWDGSSRKALTQTKDASEWLPQFSNDGLWLAFLADRGGEDAKTQVWIMPAAAARPGKSPNSRMASRTSLGLPMESALP